MKTRKALVSNSSSSSFIVDDIEINEELIAIVSGNVFCITLLVSPDKVKECFDKISNAISKHTTDKPEFDITIDEDNIVIGNVTSYKDLNNIFNIAKENEFWSITLFTGGTDSEILPQAMLQSYLIDVKTDYLVEGDGSFDLRKKDDIEDILSEYNYPGPAGALLRYYLNRINKDE